MKRLNFVVEDDVYERLENLKKKTEARSLAEVFRDALRLYHWVVSEMEKGREIVSRPREQEEGPVTQGWGRKPILFGVGGVKLPQTIRFGATGAPRRGEIPLDKNIVLERIGQFIEDAEMMNKPGERPSQIAKQKTEDIIFKLKDLTREIEETEKVINTGG